MWDGLNFRVAVFVVLVLVEVYAFRKVKYMGKVVTLQIYVHEEVKNKLNWEPFKSESLIFGALKIQKIIILPIVLYG